MRNSLLLFFFLCSLCVQAQFSVGNGSFSIYNGSEFFTESITLVPSERITLENNEFQQSSAPLQLKGSVFSIERVIMFRNPMVFTGTLRLKYPTLGLNGNQETELKLSYFKSGAWRSSNSGTVDLSTGYIEEALNANSFQGLTASAYYTTLPVSLVSFRAKAHANGGVLLQWQTTAEVNNSHFTIERSGNSSRYETIGMVPASSFSGQGNYSFLDAQPLTGTNYYRLRQHDRDGKEQLYGVRMVKTVGTSLTALVQPNPVTNNEFTVDLRKPVNKPLIYTISNAGGQVVQTGLVVSQQQWVAVNNLPTGVYLLQLGDGQTVRFQKQ